MYTVIFYKLFKLLVFVFSLSVQSYSLRNRRNHTLKDPLSTVLSRYT